MVSSLGELGAGRPPYQWSEVFPWWLPSFQALDHFVQANFTFL